MAELPSSSRFDRLLRRINVVFARRRGLRTAAPAIRKQALYAHFVLARRIIYGPPVICCAPQSIAEVWLNLPGGGRKCYGPTIAQKFLHSRSGGRRIISSFSVSEILKIVHGFFGYYEAHCFRVSPAIANASYLAINLSKTSSANFPGPLLTLRAISLRILSACCVRACSRASSKRSPSRTTSLALA